ncbi:hypothetical protein FI667_g13564, partial [Globisporangium splendens]
MSDEEMKETSLSDEHEEIAPPASTSDYPWQINDINIVSPANGCLRRGLSSRIWTIDSQISSNNEERLGAKVLGAMHDKQGEDKDLHHTSFQGSIKGWKQLSHPHLLTLYGTTPNVFVCEHGQAFREYVTEGNNYNRVFRVLYEVLLALLYLHERGFAHGAIDLDHVVIGDDQKAKLVMDFKKICGYEPDADPPTVGLRSEFREDERQFLECLEEAIIECVNVRRLTTDKGVKAGCEEQAASEHAEAHCDKPTSVEQLTADWDSKVHKKACQFIDNLSKRCNEREASTQLLSSLHSKFKDLADDESEEVHQRKRRERAKREKEGETKQCEGEFQEMEQPFQRLDLAGETNES